MADANDTSASEGPDSSPQETTNPGSKPKKSQLSLKMLLILIGLAALLTLWYSMPTVTARKYATALKDGNFAAAQEMCLPGNYTIPNADADPEVTTISAQLGRLTIPDVLYGKRTLTLGISSNINGGIVTSGATCVATRSGIRVEGIGP